MENRLRDTFDKIHAEAALKEETANFLREERYRRRRRTSRFFRMRLAAVCASFVLLLLTGGFSYKLYFTPNFYVDMDVNPSIELALNRFGRVLKADPYNDDGAMILQSVDVRNQSYEQAISTLLDEMIRRGYLTADGLVSVTIQTNNGEAEQKLLEELQSSVNALLVSHHSPASANVFAVSEEIRDCAHDYNLSPAKYLAITQLQAVDPTASFEKCAKHSISEIQQFTEEHDSTHHGESHGESHRINKRKEDVPETETPTAENRTDSETGSSRGEAVPEGRHRHGGRKHH